MHKVRIGSLFLNSKHFKDEANQTIGAPALSDQVILNRRRATSNVNEIGDAIKAKVIKYFQEKYNMKVVLRWNRYCGCTMCPCSPGFKIIALSEVAPWSRMKEDYRFDIFVEESGELDIREPKHPGTFNRLVNKERI